MRLRLLKPVASPWGTAREHDLVDVPDEVGAAWVAAGVAVGQVVEPEGAPMETAATMPPENAARPPVRPRGQATEKRG